MSEFIEVEVEGVQRCVRVSAIDFIDKGVDYVALRIGGAYIRVDSRYEDIIAAIDYKTIDNKWIGMMRDRRDAND